jgi:hypothetical protein
MRASLEKAGKVGETVPSGIGAIKPFHAFMDARAENGAPLRYRNEEVGKVSAGN